MCLIIVKPEADVISESMIRNAYEHNHNGFGMMWVEEGRVKRVKGLFDLTQILEQYREVQHKSVAMHFRYSTRGAISENNCHPFRVLNMEEHGRDLYMMHNGTMTNIGVIRAGWSDSREFVDRILRPKLLAEGIDKIKDLNFRTDLGAQLTNRNKLFFLDGDGWTGYVNKNEGHTLGDTWFSNVYSLKKKVKRGAKTAAGTANDNRTVSLNDQMELEIRQQPAVRRSGYKGRLDPDDIDALQPIAGDKFQLWIDTGHNDGRYEVFTSNEVWDAKQEQLRRAQELSEMAERRARKERMDAARQQAADELRGIVAAVPTPASRDALRRHWRANAAAELRSEPETPLPRTGIYGEFGVGDEDERVGLIDKVLGNSDKDEFGYVRGEYLMLEDDEDVSPHRVRIINRVANMTMVEYQGHHVWIPNNQVNVIIEKPELEKVNSPASATGPAEKKATVSLWPHVLYARADKSLFRYSEEDKILADFVNPGKDAIVKYDIPLDGRYRLTCIATDKCAWVVGSLYTPLTMTAVDRQNLEDKLDKIKLDKIEKAWAEKKVSEPTVRPKYADVSNIFNGHNTFVLVGKQNFSYSTEERSLVNRFYPGTRTLAVHRHGQHGQTNLICVATGRIIYKAPLQIWEGETVSESERARLRVKLRDIKEMANATKSERENPGNLFGSPGVFGEVRKNFFGYTKEQRKLIDRIFPGEKIEHCTFKSSHSVDT